MQQPHYSQEFEQYIQEHNEPNVHAYSEQKNQTIRQTLTNQIDKQMNEFNPIYDNNTPIPGEDFEVEKVYSGQSLKEEAETGLIAGAALRKARKEREAEEKRPMEERIKEAYIEGCLQALTDESYRKRGYALSGPEKRNYRKQIERNYGKKPAYTPTKEQREKLIDYINMPSSEKNQNKEVQPTTGLSTANAVSSLLSSI